MNAKHDGILTMDELAAYLKISKSTLYKLAVEDKLPGHKIGKRWRFHKDAVDRWVQYGPEPGEQNLRRTQENL